MPYRNSSRQYCQRQISHRCFPFDCWPTFEVAILNASDVSEYLRFHSARHQIPHLNSPRIAAHKTPNSVALCGFTCRQLGTRTNQMLTQESIAARLTNDGLTERIRHKLRLMLSDCYENTQNLCVHRFWFWRRTLTVRRPEKPRSESPHLKWWLEQTVRGQNLSTQEYYGRLMNVVGRRGTPP